MEYVCDGVYVNAPESLITGDRINRDKYFTTRVRNPLRVEWHFRIYRGNIYRVRARDLALTAGGECIFKQGISDRHCVLRVARVWRHRRDSKRTFPVNYENKIYNRYKIQWPRARAQRNKIHGVKMKFASGYRGKMPQCKW